MTESVMIIGNQGNNRNDEWYTPRVYVDAARRVMGGIDLDPASNELANGYIQADTFYSLENSAFENPWFGRVWMNPPYSRIIKNFTDKLVEEFEAGNVEEAIVVTNNGTDTRWFHTMSESASAFCFTQGRIAFLDENGIPQNSNNKGQVFTYFGENWEEFCSEFNNFGLTMVKPQV